MNLIEIENRPFTPLTPPTEFSDHVSRDSSSNSAKLAISIDAFERISENPFLKSVSRFRSHAFDWMERQILNKNAERFAAGVAVTAGAIALAPAAILKGVVMVCGGILIGGCAGGELDFQEGASGNQSPDSKIRFEGSCPERFLSNSDNPPPLPQESSYERFRVEAKGVLPPLHIHLSQTLSFSQDERAAFINYIASQSLNCSQEVLEKTGQKLPPKLKSLNIFIAQEGPAGAEGAYAGRVENGTGDIYYNYDYPALLPHAWQRQDLDPNICYESVIRHEMSHVIGLHERLFVSAGTSLGSVLEEGYATFSGFQSPHPFPERFLGQGIVQFMGLYEKTAQVDACLVEKEGPCASLDQVSQKLDCCISESYGEPLSIAQEGFLDQVVVLYDVQENELKVHRKEAGNWSKSNVVHLPLSPDGAESCERFENPSESWRVVNKSKVTVCLNSIGEMGGLKFYRTESITEIECGDDWIRGLDVYFVEGKRYVDPKPSVEFPYNGLQHPSVSWNNRQQYYTGSCLWKDLDQRVPISILLERTNFKAMQPQYSETIPWFDSLAQALGEDPKTLNNALYRKYAIDLKLGNEWMICGSEFVKPSLSLQTTSCEH
ncbi:MAG: hypothetical protein JNK65_06145 [Deltaproteobacteria bacterium]|nr:hypothetical protein [Deltaproteobacteria bacterium]